MKAKQKTLKKSKKDQTNESTFDSGLSFTELIHKPTPKSRKDVRLTVRLADWIRQGVEQRRRFSGNPVLLHDLEARPIPSPLQPLDLPKFDGHTLIFSRSFVQHANETRNWLGLECLFDIVCHENPGRILGMVAAELIGKLRNKDDKEIDDAYHRACTKRAIKNWPQIKAASDRTDSGSLRERMARIDQFIDQISANFRCVVPRCGSRKVAAQRS
jgi:hypothetical protein